MGEVWVWRLCPVLLGYEMIRPPVLFSGFVAESRVGRIYWHFYDLCPWYRCYSCCLLSPRGVAEHHLEHSLLLDKAEVQGFLVYSSMLRSLHR